MLEDRGQPHLDQRKSKRNTIPVNYGQMNSGTGDQSNYLDYADISGQRGILKPG